MAIKGRGLRKTVEEEVSLKKEHAAPLTLSKIQTLQSGTVSVIPTRDQPVDRLPVLSNEEGFLCAQNYDDAMTSLSVAVKPISDGSVEFELTPFLTFGDAQPVSRYRFGQLIRTTEQPTKTFDHLRCSVPLRPGQFLVFGPSNRNTAGLGHYFFTQGIGDFDQKIVVIRLLFTQHDRLFHEFPGFQEIFDKNADSGSGLDLEFPENESAEGKKPRRGIPRRDTGDDTDPLSTFRGEETFQETGGPETPDDSSESAEFVETEEVTKASKTKKSFSWPWKKQEDHEEIIKNE